NVTARRVRLDLSSGWSTKDITGYQDATRGLPLFIVEPRRSLTIKYEGSQPIEIDRTGGSPAPGEPPAPEQQVSCYHYGADGRAQDIVLPEGNEIHYDYDAAGRVTTVWKGFPSTLTGTWSAGCRGRVAPQNDRGLQGGAVSVSGFDGQGRLSSSILPDGSTTSIKHFVGYDIASIQTNQGTTLTRTYRYNTRGLLLSVEDENGQALYTATYDDHGNQTT